MKKKLELLTRIESGEVTINELSSSDQIMASMAFQKPDLLPKSETHTQSLAKLSDTQNKAIKAFLKRPITLIDKILAHDLTKPLTAEIKEGLLLDSGNSSPFSKDWLQNTKKDTTVMFLKQQYEHVGDYLCCQVHLLNLLHMHYGIAGSFPHPYLQVNTGSVIDKVKGNPYSKHENTPFKGLVLKGFYYNHIELFPFSSQYGRSSIYKGPEFESLKNKKVAEAEVRLKSDSDPIQQAESANSEAVKISNDLFKETDQAVCKKSPLDKGKVTGPWLISEKSNTNEYNYLCITPHGNSMYPDKDIKAIIDRAKYFKL